MKETLAKRKITGLRESRNAVLERRREALTTARRIISADITPQLLSRQIFSLQWQKDIKCIGKTDELFVDGEEAQQKAKKICEGCPVRLECLTDSLIQNAKGVWGGTTEEERKKIRKRGNRNSKSRDEKLIPNLLRWRTEMRTIYAANRTQAR